MNRDIAGLRLLLTGRRGFIGRHLDAALRRLGADIVDDEIDVLAIHEHTLKVDAVIHLAARTDRASAAGFPYDLLHVNVCGTLNVLEFCRRNRARLVMPSTCGVYAAQMRPVVETDPLAPGHPYAASKLLAEEACEYYSRYFGVPVIILRLFNVFGFGQSADFLLPYVIKSLREGSAPVLKTPGGLRDFVYVADVCEALVAALAAAPAEHPEHAEIMNVGSGRVVSVFEAVKLAYELCGVPLDLDGAAPTDGQPYLCSDNSRARQQLGWFPRTDFRSGLSAMVQEYQA